MHLDDATKYLLDSLDRALQDSHSMGLTAFGIVITFATSVLTVHSQGWELIRTTGEKVTFSCVLVIAISIFTIVLKHNLSDIENISKLLGVPCLMCQEPWGNLWHPPCPAHLAADIDARTAEINAILCSKSQWQHACLLFWLRVGGVTGILFAVWFFVVDLDRPTGRLVRRGKRLVGRYGSALAYYCRDKVRRDR